MNENRELVAQYIESGSEEAFRELVTRYINLVYSTALRLVGEDRHLAQDVTQIVFVRLCQNAHKLPREVMLGGWLHRDTCHVAANIVRGERRRRAREKEVALMEALPDHSKANLAAVAPVLDEAINLLDEEDRAAILLRFFERLDFRSVGAALGSNEDAARMRVSRSLEKLHVLLSKRGVALSTAALATALGGEAVIGAPVGLAASVATAALASSTAAAGATTVIKIIAMTKIKAAIVGAIVVGGVAVPLWVQHQGQVKTIEENRALQQQVEQLQTDNERLSNQVAQVTTAPANAGEQERELLKLRSEVGTLKRQVKEAAKIAAKAPKTTTTPPEVASTPEEEEKRAGIAMLSYTKGWVLAMVLYAANNQDQLPASFEQAAAYFPQELRTEEAQTDATKYALTNDRFEIVYHGSIKALDAPQSTIVIREKEAWQTPHGTWARNYAFADGHSEIHISADGNFAPWEAQHTAAPPADQPGQ